MRSSYSLLCASIDSRTSLIRLSCSALILQQGTQQAVLGSIVVSISACHAEDPGSIPGRGASFFTFFLLIYVISANILIFLLLPR